MNLVVKTLSALLSAIVISMPVFAQHNKPVLDVIIPSGNSGKSWVESVMLQEGLVELGYDSKILHTKNCVNTQLYIQRNVTRPAVFIYSNSIQISDSIRGCNIVPTRDTFVSALYFRLQTICSRKDVTDLDQVFAKNRVTIGTTNTTPDSAFDKLDVDTKTKIVRVDYNGSTNALKGLIAGDTDLLYTSYTTREFTNPEIKCWATSGVEPVNGLPTLQSMFPSWPHATVGAYKYIHSVNINNSVVAEQTKQDILTIIGSNAKMSSYIVDSHMTPGTKMRDHTVEDFLRSVELMQGN